MVYSILRLDNLVLLWHPHKVKPGFPCSLQSNVSNQYHSDPSATILPVDAAAASFPADLHHTENDGKGSSQVLCSSKTE